VNVAPTNNDVLVFRDGFTIRNITGTNATSEDDINNVTFTNVSFPIPGANAVVSLTAPLTVKNASFTNLQITGAGANSITLDPGQGGQGTVTITGMTFNTNLVLKAGETTSLSAGTPTKFNGNLDNYGTVNWAGTDQSITGTLTNKAGATFDVQCDAKLSDGNAVPGAAGVVNEGTFKKTLGQPGSETLIDMIFENKGTLEERAGTLHFGGNVSQTANAAQTLIVPATTIKAPTFSLNAGKMWAEGQFDGDLTNGAWLHLGATAGTAGTFTINGNYTQNAGGTLYVEFDNLGGISHLNVNGTATLSGDLVVHRDPNLALGANTWTVLQANRIANDFTTFRSDPAGDAWIGPGNVARTFTGFAIVGATVTVTVG
jgi:hypothetical protein